MFQALAHSALATSKIADAAQKPGCVLTQPDSVPRQPLNSQASALIAARASLDKQAENVIVMDLRRLSSVTDFFVVCTAGSTPQIQALQEHIEASLARQGVKVRHIEGVAGVKHSSSATLPQWVLMDCGDMLVHLFDHRAREFYRLEDLWADAPRISVEPATHP